MDHVRLAVPLAQPGQPLPQGLGEGRHGLRRQSRHQQRELGAIEAVGPGGGRLPGRHGDKGSPEVLEQAVGGGGAPVPRQLGEVVDPQQAAVALPARLKEVVQVRGETALVIEAGDLVAQQALVESLQFLVHVADDALDLAGHEIHGAGDMQHLPGPGQGLDAREVAQGDVPRQAGDLFQGLQGQPQHQEQQQQG